MSTIIVRLNAAAGCELCHGKGFFLAASDKYGERIEKCDDCSIFETDQEASQKACEEKHPEA